MNALAHYDAACHALAQAANVDEVLNIRDQAEVMRAYSRQAKNYELESYASEIRLRAERKLGELIIQQKATVGLAPAGRPAKSVVSDDQLNRIPTLAEMGISKDLSSRSQKLAAVPKAEFEASIAEHKHRVAAEGARVINKLEKAGAAAAKKAATSSREVDVAETEGTDDGTQQLLADYHKVVVERDELKAEISALKNDLNLLSSDDLAAQVLHWKGNFESMSGRNAGLLKKLNALEPEADEQRDVLRHVRQFLQVERNKDILPALKARAL